MLRPILLPSMAVLLSACAAGPMATAPQPEPAVRSAMPAEVAHCTALATVVGTHAQPGAMQNGLLTAQSFGSARAVALSKAKAEGATHLVWGDEIVGAAGSFITAQPYRCERVASR
jgi:hypothetical protein